MATITNQATLTYNNIVVNSNVARGEVVDVLTGTKNSILSSYTNGEKLTFIVSLINSGNMPLSNITITDNLGKYNLNENEYTPLSYVDNSTIYYVNGIKQATPTIATQNGLVISGLNVPANGNVLVIYETLTNEFAPLLEGSTITNSAVVSGGGLTNPLKLTNTVAATLSAVLAIQKAISPNPVTENGTITYTFTITNTGNKDANALDNVVLSDTFNPVLSNVSVSLNGVTITSPDDYTYDEVTGEFKTTTGTITVPAADIVQDGTTGVVSVTPGVAVLVVTGAI